MNKDNNNNYFEKVWFTFQCSCLCREINMISFLQEHSSLNTSYSVKAPWVFTPESKPNQSRVCAPSPSSKSACVLTADGLAGSVAHEHCVAASAKPEKIIVSPRVPASGTYSPVSTLPVFIDGFMTPSRLHLFWNRTDTRR